MDVKMLLLVRHLIKFDGTAVHRAEERPLSSVDAQMVEQIAPLSEHLRAPPVVLSAEENALLSTSVRVHELGLEKVPGLREVRSP